MKVLKSKKLGGLRVTRKALRHYALYRRHSLIKHHCGMEALETFHRFESTGELPEGMTEEGYLKSNGYANGKWCLKITCDQVEKDLLDGNACKAEFYEDRSGWFWRKYLKDKPSSLLFAYINYGEN